MSEIKIMAYMGTHPNIVEFLGACTKDIRKGLVIAFMEFCLMGTVESYIREKKPMLLMSESNSVIPDNQGTNLDNPDFADLLMNWSIQTSHGMMYLSHIRLIHGDLSTRNLWLKDINTIKITDFGQSRQLQDFEIYAKTNQEHLPWRHMPPESLSKRHFSIKSDVWAFGVTLWEMFSLGEIPFLKMQWNDDFVSSLENGLRLNKPSFASEEMYVLMKSCWERDPSCRPDFSSLCRTMETMMLTSHEENYEIIDAGIEESMV